MSRILRLTTVLMLLVAFGVTGLLPAAGSWSCPDGTACVYSRERGFHCLDDPCPMACCAAHRRRHGCSHCAHGAIPGIADAGPRRQTASQPDHCRYHQARQLEPASLTSPSGFSFSWHAATMLPAPIEPPVIARPWTRLAPIRGSPASAAVPSPSSPRAPPGPDCV